MGGSSYSDDLYRDRVATRSAKGIPTFDHHDAVTKGTTAAKVHDKLSPKGIIRESRDSDAHPDSTAIMVMFDVTGSMADVPTTLQAKLPQLMGLLLRKGYIKDPQILFGAVGDFTQHDRAPLQVGQFESGIEMDEDITKFWLEGGGGGGEPQESYLDAIYFAATRTAIDCHEKRGKKGYLFVIGDEKSYPSLKKEEIEAVIGLTAKSTDGKISAAAVQGDLTAKEVVDLASDKWEIFYLIPNKTSHYKHSWLPEWWARLINSQHIIKVEDPEAICETIGMTIGLMEGTVDADGMRRDLHDMGTHAKVVDATTSALDGLAKSTALAKAGTASGDLVAATGRSKAVDRL